jgi:hypothetical protein
MGVLEYASVKKGATRHPGAISSGEDMSDKKTPEIAFDYHRSLRDEIIERYKMRDAIMIAYLAATAALFGVALGKSSTQALDHPLLLLLVPFLALGACSIVTLHQDQFTAYYQYFATELRDCMAPDDQGVTSFYASRTAKEHTPRILFTLFISQLVLLCGPAVVAVLMNLALLSHSWGSNALFGTSTAVTILTGWRAWDSKRYRTRVMKKLFQKKKEGNNQVTASLPQFLVNPGNGESQSTLRP